MDSPVGYKSCLESSVLSFPKEIQSRTRKQNTQKRHSWGVHSKKKQKKVIIIKTFKTSVHGGSFRSENKHKLETTKAGWWWWSHLCFFFFFLFFSKSQDNNAGVNPRKLFHCWDRTKHIHVPKPDVPRSFDDNTEFIRWNVTGWINTARHKRLLASWPKRARHFLCLLKCRHIFFSEGDKIV